MKRKQAYGHIDTMCIILHNTRMDLRIRQIPEDLHLKFKLLCVQEKISMNQKVIAMIRQEIERAERKQK